MLKSLELRNFQAHKNTKVEFVQGVNTITGATDSGKSALMRAMRWAGLVLAGGQGFIRHKSKTARVRMRFSDGVVLTRSRDKTAAVLVVNGQTYRAFGHTPPDEVVHAINLQPENFQQQHDAPFWFDLSPAEVSRRLNSVVNLEVIDSSAKRANEHTRKAKWSLEEAATQFADAEAILAETDTIEEQSARLEKVEVALREYTELKQEVSDFENCIAEHDELSAGVERNARFLKNTTTVTKAVDGFLKLEHQVFAMELLITSGERLERKTRVEPKGIKPLEDAWKAQQSIENEVATLESLLQTIGNMRARAAKLKETADEAEQQFHENVKGQNCPMCGSKL